MKFSIATITTVCLALATSTLLSTTTATIADDFCALFNAECPLVAQMNTTGCGANATFVSTCSASFDASNKCQSASVVCGCRDPAAPTVIKDLGAPALAALKNDSQGVCGDLPKSTPPAATDLTNPIPTAQPNFGQSITPSANTPAATGTTSAATEVLVGTTLTLVGTLVATALML